MMFRLTVKVLTVFAVSAFWIQTALSQNLLLYSDRLDQRTIEGILKANPLDPDQNIRATFLFKTERTSFHLVQIRDREKPHIHQTHDLFVILQRGAGVLNIGEEKIEMKAGDSVLVPQGIPHYFVTTSPEPTVGLGIFTPPYAGKDSVPVVLLEEDSPAVEVVEHSWKIEEEWERIKKTKYSWRAIVKNNSEKRQKVSLFFVVTDSKGLPLDRNTTSETLLSGETREIHSDSYLDNNLVEAAVGSRITLETKPVP
ncbi:MAG TPA: cupin domain-containing protein [Nitrospiria bacterium]|nr:cupin domain-containing protein [Nitrospiria bacterium]